MYSVPKLGGQHAAYLAVALKEYQDGNRAHATMHAQAATLNAKDLADVSAYLAGVELKPSGRPVGTLPKAGQTCVACHGTGLAGAPKFGDKAAWAPRLKAGMPAVYEIALKGKGAMPPKGGNLSLSDADVKAAVDYMVNAAK